MPSQQSALTVQMSPPPRQKLKNEQRPARQNAVQQSPSAAHGEPATLQADAGTSQLPLTQLSEQQSVLRAHAWWNDLHVWQLTPTKQVAPKQQPLAHDWTLHTHAPPTHAWPLAH